MNQLWSNVFAPKVHSYVAETGAAAVFTEPNGRTFLGFSSAPANTGAGIRFTADVEAGADISGYLAFGTLILALPIARADDVLKFGRARGRIAERACAGEART